MSVVKSHWQTKYIHRYINLRIASKYALYMLIAYKNIQPYLSCAACVFLNGNNCFKSYFVKQQKQQR
jgi:hypothetical protein